MPAANGAAQSSRQSSQMNGGADVVGGSRATTRGAGPIQIRRRSQRRHLPQRDRPAPEAHRRRDVTETVVRNRAEKCRGAGTAFRSRTHRGAR